MTSPIITLLGFSAATVPIMLETWAAVHGIPAHEVMIVENMEQPEPEIPWLPPGMKARRVMAGHWQPTGHEVYLFGVAGSRPRRIVYQFFFDHFGIDESMYMTLVHPSANVPPSAVIGAGALIEPGTTLSSFAQVAFGASVKRGSTLGHHSTLGRCSSLNPGVTVCGRVAIGDYTEIGAGTVVSDNLTIGSNTIVGAGSVVVKWVPDNVIAYGSPCVVKKEHTVPE
jgi:acetyltransferase-like isoleucine patch superfamily enzyme